MKLSSVVNNALAVALDYLAQIDFLNTINISRIEDYSVWLDPAGEDVLYGCKLDSKSNRMITMSLQDIVSLANDIRYAHNSSEVYLHFVKKGMFQAIYVMSYNKNAIKRISKAFDSSLLTGKELVLALYNIFSVGKHHIDENNHFVFDEEKAVYDKDYFVPWDLDITSKKFKARIQNAVVKVNKEGVVYQATRYNNRAAFDPRELFLEEWEGAISMSIEFSSSLIKSSLQRYKKTARWADMDFHNTLEAIIERNNEETADEVEYKSCIVNTVAYLSNNVDTSVEKLEYLLGLSFEKNYISGERIFSKTIMQTRDYDFDAILPMSFVQQFFKTAHKKRVAKNKFVNFCGIDISGAFIDYSFLDNTSPHAIYTGRTGSGKSRQAIAGLEQTLGFDKETGEALRIDNIYVRYTDVGYTGGRFAFELKKRYPDKVKVFSSKISNLRFSLFNIEVVNGIVNEDELDHAIALLNFSIDAQNNGKGALSGNQQTILKDILQYMLLNNIYSDYYLSELEKAGVYGELLSKLYPLGFDANTTLKLLPDEYSYLKKPVLGDVIEEVKTEAKKSTRSDLQKKEINDMVSKLEGLRNFKFLTMHSNVPQTRERFTHIDFDSIKDLPAHFSITYWLLITNWIQGMKEEAKEKRKIRQENDPTFFYVDEAHNFFRYPSFAQLFITAVKEFRKYKGRLIFLTQQLVEIPPLITTEIGTKIFMVPPEDKALLESNIRKVLGDLRQDDVEVITKIDNYMMFIMSDIGSMGIKFKSDPKDDWFYEPYHEDF